MTNTASHNHPDDTAELLSSYLDDELDIVERRRADTFLNSCPGCAAELGDLRSLRVLLRELPEPVPRRSFTLDPAVVRPRLLLFPVFRFASLAAAVLLLVVIGVDIVERGSSAAPTAELSQPEAARESAPQAEDEAFSMQEAPTAAAALEAPAAAGGGAEPEPSPPVALAAPPPSAEETAAVAQDTASGASSAAGADGVADATAMAEDAGAGEATAAAGSAPEVAQDESDATTGAADGDAYPPMPPGSGGDDIGTLQDQPAGGESPVQPEARVEETAAQQVEAEPQPLPVLRALEYLLAALVFAFGLGTWWTARRGI